MSDTGCTIKVAHCGDCGSTDLHEGPNDPPPWCCCMACGSAFVIEVGDECDGNHDGMQSDRRDRAEQVSP